MMNRNFMEREIYKISNFYILLKFKNAYYPVINNQNIIFNIKEHKDFFNTIKCFQDSNIFSVDSVNININNENNDNENNDKNSDNKNSKNKKIDNKVKNDIQITNFSKMKKEELIKLCIEKNIEYEYIDDKTKKIKTLTKPNLIKQISGL